ncbi:hypothetical protein BDZ97DRAFT_1119862 [Flammula alnicola]|nr:hypothetical protein BDZ97DRAFT_1119862 [Flammula alnicola]
MSPKTCLLSTLPIEVAEKIFLFYLSDLRAFIHANIRQGPLFLCRISSSWRQYALAMPSLWDDLLVSYDRPSKLSFNPPISGVKTWFERAGPTRPLTLRVQGSSPRQGTPQSIIMDFQTLLAYIKASAHRFRVISVSDYFSPGDEVQAHFSNSNHIFTNLEALFLRVYGGKQSDAFPNVFRAPTSLRRLVISTSPRHSFGQPISGWERLTHLQMTSYTFTPAQFIEQLRLCPLLTVADLWIEGSEQPPLARPPVRLNHLRDLELYLQTPDLGFLASHIENLNTIMSRLHLRTTRPEARVHPQHLAPHQLGTTLRDLSLEFLELGTRDLETILEASPGLTTLILQLPCLPGSAIARMLTRSRSNPRSVRLLPALDTLTLYVYLKRERYVPEVYADMVTSRRGPKSSPLASLRDVTLAHRGNREYHYPEVERLEVLLKRQTLAGLRLYVADPSYIYSHNGPLRPPEWL